MNLKLFLGPEYLHRAHEPPDDYMKRTFSVEQKSYLLISSHMGEIPDNNDGQRKRIFKRRRSPEDSMKRSRNRLDEEMVINEYDNTSTSAQDCSSPTPPNNIKSWNVRSHRQQDSTSLHLKVHGREGASSPSSPTIESASRVLTSHVAETSINDQSSTLLIHTSIPSANATQIHRNDIPPRHSLTQPPSLNYAPMTQGLRTISLNQ